MVANPIPKKPKSGSVKPTVVPKKPYLRKSKEQIDYLTSHMSDYLTHKDAKTLDRFWPSVFDGWYKKWPIDIPTPEPGEEHSLPADADAAVALRSHTNDVRILSHFHSRAPKPFPSSTDHSHLVPQQGPPHFRFPEIRLTVEPTGKTTTTHHPSLLLLRVGLRSQGRHCRPLGRRERAIHRCGRRQFSCRVDPCSRPKDSHRLQDQGREGGLYVPL